MPLASFLDEMVKISALTEGTQLRKHQEDAVNYLVQSGGRGLLAHGTGSGKTLSSLAVIENLREKGKADKTLVVLPASLRTNFAESGVEKFTDRTHGPVGSGADYQLISMEKFRKDPDAALDESGADSLIIDEIHRAKNKGSKTYEAYRRAAPQVENLVGLTGSFISNHPREIVPLMDIVHPEHQLGTQRGFSRVHTKKRKIKGVRGGFLRKERPYKVNLRKKGRIRKKVKGQLHYLGLGAMKDLPGLEVSDVHVPMSRDQDKHYRFALGRLSKWERNVIRRGLPVSQVEAEWILPRITRARQAANSVRLHTEMPPAMAAEKTPKLRKVMDDVQDHLDATPDGQAIIYTNFRETGARELYEGLKARGTPVGMYSGANKKTRDDDVKDFKTGKKKAIVMTPAGGEGISLDNATFFAEVDRHYNPERNQQAIARGRRMGGLQHREEKDRVLKVNRYHSVPTRYGNWKEVGVDEWIGTVADEKNRLNRQMRKAVRK